MATILVVDDVQFILESIGEILRREGYEVICATRGREALTALGSRKFDLMLLDVMLPDVSGLAVLNAVRANVRLRDLPVILLTSTADEDHVRQAARLGIQGYILKSSFNVTELLARVKKIIGSAVPAAGPSLSDGAEPTAGAASTPQAAPTPEAAPRKPKSRDEVLACTRRQIELRSVPPVLQEVIAMASSCHTRLDDVVEAVRQDQALTIKLMKVANSSFYAAGKRVQTLWEAAQRIGMEGVRNAATAILAIDHFAEASCGGLIPQRFWEHSLATAMLAQLIAKAVNSDQADDAFLAGLLHDVGRLLLSGVYPELYAEVLATARQQGRDVADIENQVFGVDHAAIAAEALRHLKISDAVTSMVAQHGQSIKQLERSGPGAQSCLILILADRLARTLAIGDGGNAMIAPLHDVAAALHLDAERVGSIARDAARRSREAELFYACQANTTFRESYAAELSGAGRDPLRLAVLAGDPAIDPLSIFFERLKWIDSRTPQTAVIYITSAAQAQRRWYELLGLEQAVGIMLNVLVVSSDPSFVLPPHFAEGRTIRLLYLPCRCEALVAAVRDIPIASAPVQSAAACRPIA